MASGSSFRMKLISACCHSDTFLDLCVAVFLKPRLVNSVTSSCGFLWQYSTNSKPSVPIGFSNKSAMTMSFHVETVGERMRCKEYEAFGADFKVFRRFRGSEKALTLMVRGTKIGAWFYAAEILIWQQF